MIGDIEMRQEDLVTVDRRVLELRSTGAEQTKLPSELYCLKQGILAFFSFLESSRRFRGVQRVLRNSMTGKKGMGR